MKTLRQQQIDEILAMFEALTPDQQTLALCVMQAIHSKNVYSLQALRPTIAAFLPDELAAVDRVINTLRSPTVEVAA